MRQSFKFFNVSLLDSRLLTYSLIAACLLGFYRYLLLLRAIWQKLKFESLSPVLSRNFSIVLEEGGGFLVLIILLLFINN